MTQTNSLPKYGRETVKFLQSNHSFVFHDHYQSAYTCYFIIFFISNILLLQFHYRLMFTDWFTLNAFQASYSLITCGKAK